MQYFYIFYSQRSTVNSRAIRMAVIVFVFVYSLFMVNGQQSTVYGLHPEGSQKLTANG